MFSFTWINGIEHKERIEKFLYKVDKQFFPTLSERVTIKSYAEKLAKNAENIIVGNDGYDIGICSVYMNNTTAFISSIAVIEKFYRRGIGKKMLDEVVAKCREKGCYSICLETCSGNSGALLFYKNYGFITIVKKDNIIRMELKI